VQERTNTVANIKRYEQSFLELGLSLVEVEFTDVTCTQYAYSRILNRRFKGYQFRIYNAIGNTQLIHYSWLDILMFLFQPWLIN